MFNTKYNSNEIAISMENSLVSNAKAEKNKSLNKFAIALDYINEASECFEDLGLVSEAEATIKLLETISIKKTALDAENIRDNVETSIETALKNKGFVDRIIAFAKHYPEIYAIRLYCNVKSGLGSSEYTKITCEMFAQPKDIQASNVLNSLVSEIEFYLNSNYELYPQKVNGENVSYNNFNYTIEIKVNDNIVSSR